VTRAVESALQRGRLQLGRLALESRRGSHVRSPEQDILIQRGLPDPVTAGGPTQAAWEDQIYGTLIRKFVSICAELTRIGSFAGRPYAVRLGQVDPTLAWHAVFATVHGLDPADVTTYLRKVHR
jgi:hypothetical protein